MILSSEVIQKIIVSASIRGHSGDCGEAAKAINQVFFDKEGKLAFATNPHMPKNPKPYIGHVACLSPRGRLWDATGEISTSDLEGWGVVDPYLADQHGLAEEDRFDHKIVLMEQHDERWTLCLKPKNSVIEKIEKLLDAIFEV